MSLRPTGRGHGALVALVALAAYARTLGFGFTGLDDQDLIVDDQAFLAQPSSLWRVFGRAYMHVVDAAHAYYRPLVTFTYALDAQWSGARPFGYHATNVVLHLAASLLVWALLRRVSLGRGVALLGALVFASHPALVPAVAWMPGRNDSLLAVFALAAWLSLLRGRFALHVVTFAAALLTKETAALLPLVWALHATLLREARPPPRAMAAVAASWVLLVGARVALHPPHETATLANVLRLVRGLGELALPVHLSAIAVDEDIPLWPGLVAAMAILAAALWVPGVRVRVVALGAGTFGLLMLPAALLPGSLALGQRLYLPAVGLLIVGGELLRAAAPEPRGLAAGTFVTVLGAGVLTLGFESSFRSPRAFALDAVSGSPHSALAHFCLGESAQRAGEDDLAFREYRAALALGRAEVVHNNLAVLEMKRALWPEAEADLRQELAVSPRYAKAYYNLGIVLRHEGRAADACSAEEDALRLQPDDQAARAERERDCAPP